MYMLLPRLLRFMHPFRSPVSLHGKVPLHGCKETKQTRPCRLQSADGYRIPAKQVVFPNCFEAQLDVGSRMLK